MGGIGSGNQWSTTTKLEEVKRVDIRFMKKKGFLKPYTSGQLSWTCRGEADGYIRFHTLKDSLILSYNYRSSRHPEWMSIEQRVQFARTPCNYGGERTWFICSICSRRVGVLYGVTELFVCRHCSDLKYASQSEHPYERIGTKLKQLEGKMFEGESWDKRKGMHQNTFESLFESWKDLKTLEDEYFAKKLMPILKKYA